MPLRRISLHGVYLSVFHIEDRGYINHSYLVLKTEYTVLKHFISVSILAHIEDREYICRHCLTSGRGETAVNGI